jgi:replication factor C subunit 3/5
MALWVDRYRPNSLETLTYHPELTLRLQKLVLLFVDRSFVFQQLSTMGSFDQASSGDLPHLLFYGPSGAGKKTRILALLRALYGPGVEKVKTEHKIYKINSKKLDIFMLNSLFHIELNVSDAGTEWIWTECCLICMYLIVVCSCSTASGNHDRTVLPDLLQETSQTVQLDAAQQKQFKGIHSAHNTQPMLFKFD